MSEPEFYDVTIHLVSGTYINLEKVDPDKVSAVEYGQRGGGMYSVATKHAAYLVNSAMVTHITIREYTPF